MMLGDFPPHSSHTRFMFDWPEYCSISLPVRVEPVKAMQSTSMCSASAWPAVWPKPGSTLNTPSGMPASDASAAMRMAVSGDFSDGFRMNELPAASAGPIFQAAMINGKFQGTMAATTPIGSRVINASASGPVGATSSYTLSTASAYQAMQRAVDGMSTARLSEMGFPMSIVSSSASSSPCCRISSANRSSTRLRSRGACRDHTPLSNARRAAATARSTSALSVEATFAMTLPSIGLTQSNCSPETAGTYLPSMNASPLMERERARSRQLKSVPMTVMRGLPGR